MSRAPVTAIIPTTGRPSVRRAVASALRQSAVAEILVVLDDPDSFTYLTRRLEGLHCSIVRTAGRCGAAAARNLGVQFAETQYVAFLDDDDEWVTDKTQLQLREADAETAVSSRAMLVGTSSRVVPERLYGPALGSLADYVMDRSSVQLRQHFIQTSTLLCSREAALATPWAEELPRHQDWDWLIRLQAAGITVLQRPEVLVKVAQGSPGSISRKPDWRASRTWLHGLQRQVSAQPAADFTASVIARGAFESKAWASGLGALIEGLRNGAHPTALLVGASGILRAGGRHV
ncbi:glycosyltransferase family 2 protein [Garicola koreensis]|uniref:Glycosyltransferase involved in cell wall biosynthesis n=1 Tax=Garicola koreensis TaxID=1262554 RepID=A0A7W5XZL7_9MICC|nr:glycosyltransferase family 2 protein [Garicola koreensis]MBB3667581.1 glycosyltransferase involved in cell wall biosynthesis [Garicola koreensis]